MPQEVEGELAQDWVRVAVGRGCSHQVHMESLDSSADGTDGVLGRVHRSRRAEFFASIEFLELSLNFGFDGFGCGFVGEDAVELADSPSEVPQALAFIQ